LHQRTSSSSTSFKSVLEGWRFESVEVIKEHLLAELSSTPKEVFQECFQNWKKVEESTSKGSKPNSSKVSEKMIYLNSQSLWTDLI
jgi:hypothetical protein